MGGRALRRVLLGVLLAVGLAATAAVAGGILLASLPGVGDAPARVAAILREHGGQPVSDPPPRRVSLSLLAVEDRRFFEHHGVDLWSLARLAWSAMHGGDLQAEGGSTIAQQLAKRVYTGDHAGVAVKLRQVGLAVKLERRYPKDQILRMYLDVAYFGAGHWGVVRASQGYFGKPPSELRWGEASLLAGLVQAPSLYDPAVHLAAARRRQRHVLDRLIAARVLRRDQAERASQELADEAPRLGFRTIRSS